MSSTFELSRPGLRNGDQQLRWTTYQSGPEKNAHELICNPTVSAFHSRQLPSGQPDSRDRALTAELLND
jgi:hypothetical protein